MSALIEAITAKVARATDALRDELLQKVDGVVSKDDLEREVAAAVGRWMEANAAEHVERAVLQMLATSAEDAPSLRATRRAAVESGGGGKRLGKGRKKWVTLPRVEGHGHKGPCGLKKCYGGVRPAAA